MRKEAIRWLKAIGMFLLGCAVFLWIILLISIGEAVSRGDQPPWTILVLYSPVLFVIVFSIKNCIK